MISEKKATHWNSSMHNMETCKEFYALIQITLRLILFTIAVYDVMIYFFYKNINIQNLLLNESFREVETKIAILQIEGNIIFITVVISICTFFMTTLAQLFKNRMFVMIDLFVNVLLKNNKIPIHIDNDNIQCNFKQNCALSILNIIVHGTRFLVFYSFGILSMASGS
ncbi:hypothetical protein A3Q56_06524 [Intoshia linei]|uniref:Uncharacterized protein n=1 Tax=Intoshia linei TaxID=1819745 RepID=A0A177AWM6_9BILA|nr:hypothetical protein A3Q56_06524 [Intoshia linei]